MQYTCVVYVYAVCIHVCHCPCACVKAEENGGGPAYHTLPKSLRQGLTVELGWPPANPVTLLSPPSTVLRLLVYASMPGIP